MSREFRLSFSKRLDNMVAGNWMSTSPGSVHRVDPFVQRSI
jgi:hypothetical protein